MRNEKSNWFSIGGSKMLHMMEGNRTVCKTKEIPVEQLNKIKRKNPTEHNKCHMCRINLPSLKAMNVQRDNLYMARHYFSLEEPRDEAQIPIGFSARGEVVNISAHSALRNMKGVRLQ